MPATSEDAPNSSSDELDSDDQISSEGGRGKRGIKRDTTSSTLIDRVVLEKRDKFQPSAYAQSYGDYEEDEEWTVLSPRGNRDESTTLLGPKRSCFSSIRRHIGFLMCFLALLTFVMAMLVCVVWAVPGIFTDTFIIAPNDTVMAAHEVDTRDTDNILYTLSSLTDEIVNSSESLVIYNGTCNGLRASSVEVHINDTVRLSEAGVMRFAIGRVYLAPASTLDYTIKLSLSSSKVPSDCFATLHLFKDYFDFKSFLSSNNTNQAASSYNFCINSTIHFTLVVKDSPSYYFFALYTANRGQVESVNIQASGTIFYYDPSSFLLNKICHIIPSVNSSCTVPTGHQTYYASVCLLITRGIPYIPGTDPNTIATIAMSNSNPGASGSDDNNDDIIQLKRKVTTYWGINRAAVFVCLFVPMMISCCVLTILTPRRANYGSYIWINRKKPLN